MKSLLDRGIVPVSIGGDHSVTLPLLRAIHAKHGQLALVHFDAHCDVSDTQFGSPYHYGSVFRRAVEEKLIHGGKTVQIGIRTVFAGERTYGFKIVYADEVHESTSAQLADIIRKVVGSNNAYLTFDIDCLDPSVAPGTGTPIPGGLSYHQAAAIIRKLTDINFVAMDVVEVSPPYDHADITSLAASSLIMEYLCLKAWQKGARAAPVAE